MKQLHYEFIFPFSYISKYSQSKSKYRLSYNTKKHNLLINCISQYISDTRLYIFSSILDSHQTTKHILLPHFLHKYLLYSLHDQFILSSRKLIFFQCFISDENHIESINHFNLHVQRNYTTVSSIIALSVFPPLQVATVMRQNLSFKDEFCKNSTKLVILCMIVLSIFQG